VPQLPAPLLQEHRAALAGAEAARVAAAEAAAAEVAAAAAEEAAAASDPAAAAELALSARGESMRSMSMRIRTVPASGAEGAEGAEGAAPAAAPAPYVPPPLGPRVAALLDLLLGRLLQHWECSDEAQLVVRLQATARSLQNGF
jgi:hypothetical protein